MKRCEDCGHKVCRCIEYEKSLYFWVALGVLVVVYTGSKFIQF